MNKVLKVLIPGSLLAMCLPMSSCKKENPSPVPPPALAPGVYITGYEQRKQFGSYWKNGTPVNLSGEAYETQSEAIAVSGADVYIAGNRIDAGKSFATYWKNGTEINLTDGSLVAYSTSIATSGNDVYVSGWENNVAKYWKNGIPVTIAASNGSFNSSYPLTIAVSGTDVYVAGTVVPGGAAYWNNGSMVFLTDGTNYSYASGMVISGSDVYVSGTTGMPDGSHQSAVYWKNGIATTLGFANGYYASYSTAIAVSGNDIYVAGGMELKSSSGDYTMATLWKNGNVVQLLGDSRATAVSVSGTDVLVAGSSNISSSSFAVYWKNGSLIKLDDGANFTQSWAQGIAT